MKTLLAWLSSLVLALIYSTSAYSDDFDSAGVKIHYIVAGQGDPVILVHGLYSSAFINWQMPGTFNELAKHYQVIAFDCRGHGASGKPTQDGQYGTQMVNDIIRLMDHLHIAKAHVVGYSMGGMIVMKLLAMYPQRVSTAVLGGMGWLKEGGLIDAFWAGIKGEGRGQGGVPPACLRGFAKLGLTQKDVMGIRVPITCIVGDKDPCRELYVEPLIHVRSDIPVMLVKGAGHFSCIVMPQFKSELETALARP
jgi:hypothetical protein